MSIMSITEHYPIAGNLKRTSARPEPLVEILPPETSISAQSDPPRTLYRLLYLFWCWRGRFLIVFGMAVLLGIVSLFFLPVRYTAKASIIVGAREPDPLVVSQNAVREPRNRELEIEGEIELITSLSTVRRVVQNLNLAQRPEFERAAANAKPSTVIRLRDLLLGGEERATSSSDPTDIIVTDLKQHLKVERIGRSAIIQISFTTGNPKFAAEVVNAIAQDTAVNDGFLGDLTLADRAGFDLLKAWVVSPAIVPHQPLSPNIRLVILVTVVFGVGTGVAVILLSDLSTSQKVLNTDQIRRQGVRTLALNSGFRIDERQTVTGYGFEPTPGIR